MKQSFGPYHYSSLSQECAYHIRLQREGRISQRVGLAYDEDDARLWAASPDLLASLKSAIKLLERDAPEDGVTATMCKQFKDVIRRAAGNSVYHFKAEDK